MFSNLLKQPTRQRSRGQKNTRRCILAELSVLCLLCISFFLSHTAPGQAAAVWAKAAAGHFFGKESTSTPSQPDYIKWVDFGVTCQAMNQAFRYDVDTCQSEIHLNWVDLLAYLGAKYGGDFSLYKASDLEQAAEALRSGETTVEDLTQNMKYYSYYRQAYGAVLDGLVGEYEAQIPKEQAPGVYLPSGVDGGTREDPETVWVKKYGLKAFSPIAKSFPYSDYDDFGTARSYGFKRQHLGHDMMGQVGTPIIAVESCYVEAIGWNQYGGWRLGLRSFDKKRYYYYAHLRQNYPYQSNLKEGSIVSAGDVIGYLGRTGYSATENTNNIDEPHLHFGLQLIFDESQKEGNNEIWIDCFELTRFLSMNRSEVKKVEGTKEWARIYGIKDPVIPENAEITGQEQVFTESHPADG